MTAHQVGSLDAVFADCDAGHEIEGQVRGIVLVIPGSKSGPGRAWPDALQGRTSCCADLGAVVLLRSLFTIGNFTVLWEHCHRATEQTHSICHSHCTGKTTYAVAWLWAWHMMKPMMRT